MQSPGLLTRGQQPEGANLWAINDLKNETKKEMMTIKVSGKAGGGGEIFEN